MSPARNNKYLPRHPNKCRVLKLLEPICLWRYTCPGTRTQTRIYKTSTLDKAPYNVFARAPKDMYLNSIEHYSGVHWVHFEFEIHRIVDDQSAADPTEGKCNEWRILHSTRYFMPKLSCNSSLLTNITICVATTVHNDSFS